MILVKNTHLPTYLSLMVVFQVAVVVVECTYQTYVWRYPFFTHHRIKDRRGAAPSMLAQCCQYKGSGNLIHVKNS